MKIIRSGSLSQKLFAFPHKERRPADRARGTVELGEEEEGDAINNNSGYNPVPDRCLWIKSLIRRDRSEIGGGGGGLGMRHTHTHTLCGG